ncbi:MAG: anaerobic ribonucleoside-triphosphate reductase activating protein [Kiritimatiellales bacterium]
MPEDSPVYAFLEKPSMIDYPGYLCGTFFTSGCNFTCGFCHNATLMGRKKKCLTWGRLREVCAKFKTEWVDAVCITGGEPTLEPDLPKLIQFMRDFDFKVKLDSNGSRPEMLEMCLPLIDYIAMDIKSSVSAYPQLTGFSQLEKITQSVQLIMNSGIEYEFRTTVIEPFHTDAQMGEIGELIRGAKRYTIQPFLPQENLPNPEMRTLRRTTPERLHVIEKIVAPYVQEVIVRGAGI